MSMETFFPPWGKALFLMQTFLREEKRHDFSGEGGIFHELGKSRLPLPPPLRAIVIGEDPLFYPWGARIRLRIFFSPQRGVGDLSPQNKKPLSSEKGRG